MLEAPNWWWLVNMGGSFGLSELSGCSLPAPHENCHKGRASPTCKHMKGSCRDPIKEPSHPDCPVAVTDNTGYKIPTLEKYGPLWDEHGQTAIVGWFSNYDFALRFSASTPAIDGMLEAVSPQLRRGSADSIQHCTHDILFKAAETRLMLSGFGGGSRIADYRACSKHSRFFF